MLHASGAEHTFNTNVNATDPQDHKAAIHIAESLCRPIVVCNAPFDETGEGSLDYVYPRLDLARDVYRGRRTVRFFEQKGARHALIIGGHAGELLRDTFSHHPTLGGTIEAFYSGGVSLGEQSKRRRIARLREKLELSLNRLGFETNDRVSERIYFFEKMRVWGGSRTSVFNRYTSFWQPLMDHRVQRHILCSSLHEKSNVRLQRSVIELHHDLARLPYTTSMKQRSQSGKHLGPWELAARITRRAGRLIRLGPAPRLEQRLAVPDHLQPYMSEFEARSGILFSQCEKAENQTRYLSLLETYSRYADKVTWSHTE